MSPEDQKALARAFRDFNKQMRTTPLTGDRPASSLLKPGERWNLLLNAISTYFNGVRLEEVSLLDYREYEDTEVNWRVVEGYGALVEVFARDLPVTCSCAVEKVTHSGPRLRLETSLGVLTVDKVIITVSSDVLANEIIRFDPALPDKIESAGNLPLGLVNKAFFHCDVPLPKDGHLFGNMHTMDTGSYHLRPFGRPLIEAFYAGDLARNLAREGANGAASFGIEELVGLLGGDVRKALRPVAVSSWDQDPYIRGSYSHARIGYSAARETLAEDVEDRIFFAGEATSGKWFSTTHGAYLSGIEAAHRALGAEALGTLVLGDPSAHDPTVLLKH
jgi:monoamine oxidase